MEIMIREFVKGWGRLRTNPSMPGTVAEGWRRADLPCWSCSPPTWEVARWERWRESCREGSWAWGWVSRYPVWLGCLLAGCASWDGESFALPCAPSSLCSQAVRVTRLLEMAKL